jgi:hypothetical protein
VSRVFWQAFGLAFSAVVGGLWWLIGYMARFPEWGAAALGVAAFVAAGAFMRWFMAKAERPASGDDGSGERPVWSALDVQDRLSPHSAWTQGDSILPGPDDTREMPKPDDRTRVYSAGLFDLRVSRPSGKHRAGVR